MRLSEEPVACNERKKRSIQIDAVDWTVRRDLYDAVLEALGPPDWHGGSRYGLESMVWGEVNAIEPPYTLQIFSTANLPPDVTDELVHIKHDVEEGRAEFNRRRGHDVDVAVELFKAGIGAHQ